MTEDLTDSMPDDIQKARVTYDRSPQYPPAFLANPVYLKTKGIFERKVNKWDFADGADFIQTIGDAGLGIENVVFVDYFNKDEHGGASVLKPSAFMFDSKRNAIRLLDLQGKVQDIRIAQYRVVSPNFSRPDNTIRMHTGTDPKNDLSVDFSLRVLPSSSTGESPLPDIDQIFVVPGTETPDMSKLARATQRHADHYINTLMILDPEEDEERLNLQMGQIHAAVKRLEAEEVGSVFHPTLVDMKLKGAAGRYVERHLAKLVQNDVHTIDDVKEVEEAIELVETGKATYPVNVEALKEQLQNSRSRIYKRPQE